MEGSDADIIMRMREQAGSFEAQTNNKDDRVNDGNNYKGLMKADDYKKRRVEVLGGEELALEKQREKVANALQADRTAAVQDARDREERERLRKEKLQRELQKATDDTEVEADDVSREAPKKKKKRKKGLGETAGLSFDAEEDG